VVETHTLETNRVASFPGGKVQSPLSPNSIFLACCLCLYLTIHNLFGIKMDVVNSSTCRRDCYTRAST
jgi:hypothetical protein